MAMKGLIEEECGRANPLMKFANHFVHNERNLPPQVADGRNHLMPIYKFKPLEVSSTQELADEFLSSCKLGAPSTFNMHCLLQEIHQQAPEQHLHIEHLQHHQTLLQPQYNSLNSLDLEFEMHQQQHQDEAATWGEEFKAEVPAWEEDFMRHREAPLDEAFNEAVGQSASSLVGPLEPEGASSLSQSNKPSLDLQTGAEWAQEFASGEEQAMWSDMVQEWKKLSDGWQEDGEWEQKFQDLSFKDVYKEYKFEEDSGLKMDGKEALSEGVKRMNEGDVANAVLLLETAVKQDPTNAMAWFYLGTSQADNEQEALAIAAFNKCLELDPKNLKALQSVAVGYTNEGIPSKAYEHLLAWISCNPKYQSLVASTPAFEANDASHTAVLDLFLRAVNAEPNNIDPELQTCLGIIFNLSGEYRKAVDCFRTALHMTPQDSMLWNKLGATLANGDMSEQSIEAYREALSLRPGYVRTRFNLGVACINLGAYRESVEHFLSALKLQSQATKPTSMPSSQPSSSSSSSSAAAYQARPPPAASNMWQNLRLSFSLLDRNDLIQACDNYDLQHLLDVYNM